MLWLPLKLYRRIKIVEILPRQVITALIITVYASKKGRGMWGGMGGGGQRGRIGKL